MGTISFGKTRAALVASSVALGAIFLASGALTTSPALAQQAIPAATSPIPADIAVEVSTRLGRLAPILRNANSEMARLGVPEAARDTCAARGVLYARTLAGLRSDQTYSYAIARADMNDLENMTRFATCTLPGGTQAKLVVCSTFGMALSGKLSGIVFDPRSIDIRPLEVRCSGQPQRQAALN